MFQFGSSCSSKGSLSSADAPGSELDTDTTSSTALVFRMMSVSNQRIRGVRCVPIFLRQRYPLPPRHDRLARLILRLMGLLLSGRTVVEPLPMLSGNFWFCSWFFA